MLVVDDEAPARRRLAALLADVPAVEIVGEAADGLEAVTRIESLTPDLVLLDIRMPGLGGFEVIEALGAAMPPVVFVTAYDAHALRAFDVRALDYLLKPVEPARLRDAIERARALRRAPRAERTARADAAVELAAAEVRPLHRLLASDAAGAMALVAVDDIVLARAQRNYVILRTATGEFRLRGTIATLEARLERTHFLRVNRSDIVRLDAIQSLAPWSHGDYRLVLPDGSALLWSRRYRARDAAQFELTRAHHGADARSL